MADGDDGAVLKQVHRLFDRGTVAGMAEGQLLERFVARGDEAAFEALVSRHGPMVLGICRQRLRDPNDVDDAFQATFLVLVRKASAIRRGDRLGPWLFGVATRVSTRARRHADARRGPLDDVAAASLPCEAERLEVMAALHDEVARLPESYRAPIVLCYLEGLTHNQAAERLGWPVGTVRGRLSRARDRLRDRLSRRGIAPEGGPAAMVALLQKPSAPVPERLAEATVRLATRFATGKATAGLIISSQILTLAEGMLHTMLIQKLKFIAIGALSIVVAAGTGVLAYQGAGTGIVDEPPKADRSAETPKADTKHAEQIQHKAELQKQVVAELNAQIAEPSEDERVSRMAEAHASIELLQIEAELAKNQFQQAAQQFGQLETSGVRSLRMGGGLSKVDQERREDEITKSVTETFKRSRERYLDARTKLAREESRLAKLEREAPGRPNPAASRPEDAGPLDDGQVALQDKALANLDILRIEVNVMRTEIKDDEQKLMSAMRILSQVEAAGITGNVLRGQGDLLLLRQFEGAAEGKEKEQLKQKLEDVYQTALKQAKVYLENSKAQFLKAKLQLGREERRLARLERETAVGSKDEAKAPPDLERRLSEIETKLNRLLEASEGKKRKTP